RGTERLAACAESGAVSVYDVRQGTDLRAQRFNLFSVTSLAYAPDGRLALGCDDKKVRIWDKVFQEQQGQQQHYGANVERVLFSADGKRLAVVTRDSDANKPPVLHWHDGATLREILAVTDLPNPVNAIALDKAGRRLAVATATDVRIY